MLLAMLMKSQCPLYDAIYLVLGFFVRTKLLSSIFPSVNHSLMQINQNRLHFYIFNKWVSNTGLLHLDDV